MNKSKIIILLLIPLLFSSLNQGFAEDFYYISDHLLEDPPLFCAMEFEDNQLPDAPSELMNMAESAVLEWEEHLVEATNNPRGWDFQFKKFSIQEQEELFFDFDCIVNIYFERQPPEGQWEYSGYADSYLLSSDIVIYYLEPSYEYTGNTVEIDGEVLDESEIIGFENNLASDIQSTLLHEIGHSLGLDHPKFENTDFVTDQFGNGFHSPSIMIDPSEYNIPGEIHYKITDYDVRSVINLYGEDGINEIHPFGLIIDFIVIGAILAIIAYFVIRRYRRKDSALMVDKPESITLKTTPEEVFPRLQNALASVGHKIVTVVPNQTIVSEGKHDFSTALMVILILFLWPAAIIYYFHSKRSLTIVLTAQNPDSCKINVTSNGGDGDRIRNIMFDKLEDEYEKSEPEIT